MFDWKNLKGPWKFTPQGDKFGYLNNPRWQVVSRKFVVGGLDDYTGNESNVPKVFNPPDSTIPYSSGSEKTHEPCGYWIRQLPPPAPPAPLSFPWYSCPMSTIYIGNGLFWFFTTDDGTLVNTIYVLQYDVNKGTWSVIYTEGF